MKLGSSPAPSSSFFEDEKEGEDDKVGFLLRLVVEERGRGGDGEREEADEDGDSALAAAGSVEA